MIVVKNTDDILVGGSLNARHTIVDKLGNVYKPVTVSGTPGLFSYFGLKIS